MSFHHLTPCYLFKSSNSFDNFNFLEQLHHHGVLNMNVYSLNILRFEVRHDLCLEMEV
jgi:hypothetical protein